MNIHLFHIQNYFCKYKSNAAKVIMVPNSNTGQSFVYLCFVKCTSHRKMFPVKVLHLNNGRRWEDNIRMNLNGGKE
jgi:hypothetical protein